MIDKSVREEQQTSNGDKYLLRDFVVREVVRGIPNHGQEYEDACVGRVFHWIKTNIAYIQDPTDYDMYMTVGRTISSGAGDCDDHCIAVCSMLTLLGFRTGARICSPDGSAWHIYAIAGVRPWNNPQKIVALDTTQEESYPGWEPPPVMRAYEMQTTFVLGKPQTLLVTRWAGKEKGGIAASRVKGVAGL